MGLKPSSSAFAKAHPAPGGKGFLGQFALPGIVPDVVKEGGKPKVFLVADDAELAAFRAMFGKMSIRSKSTKRVHEYTRMSGDELAVAIAEAALTPTNFARLYGVPPARVVGWIDGVQEIPHSANVLVRLFADPATRDRAIAITDGAAKE